MSALQLLELSEGNQALVVAVAEAFNVTVEDIFSRRRPADIALARQACMAAIRGAGRESDPTLAEIGTMFGGRDHATVIHAVKTVTEKLRAGNEGLARAMAAGYRARTMQTTQKDDHSNA